MSFFRGLARSRVPKVNDNYSALQSPITSIKASLSATPHVDLAAESNSSDLVINPTSSTTPTRPGAPDEATRRGQANFISTVQEAAKNSPNALLSSTFSEIKPTIHASNNDNGGTGPANAIPVIKRRLIGGAIEGGRRIAGKSAPTPWTHERKEQFVRLMLKRGLAAEPIWKLAKELGVTRQQMYSATRSAQRYNLRWRLINAAKWI